MANQIEQTKKTCARQVIALVQILFLVACLLPCIDCGPDLQSGDPGFPDFEAGRQYGLTILLFGWSGGNNGVPWCANVFLAVSLFCFAKKQIRLAILLSGIASLLGLSTWWARRYDTLLVGYYVWQLSMFASFGGAIWAARSSGRLAVVEDAPLGGGFRRAPYPSGELSAASSCPSNSPPART
jgi:hypothetical protein